MKRVMVSAMAVAMALAGCTSSSERPHPTVTTTDAIFSSQEDALYTASSTYMKFLRVEDAVSAEGGKNPERLKPLVTREMYDAELRSFRKLSSNKLSLEGESKLTNVKIQQITNLNHTVRVTAYGCLSGNYVLRDKAGKDVSPSSLGNPKSITFTVLAIGNAQSSVVSENKPWFGSSLC